MQCYYCDEVARANCRFCGAGLCKAHVSAWRFVSGWAHPSTEVPTMADYVAVENAIWCGRCRVLTYRQGV